MEKDEGVRLPGSRRAALAARAAEAGVTIPQALADLLHKHAGANP
jgi:LDH2 family malate/lactate/ureidoglycolate dehydrogenase